MAKKNLTLEEKLNEAIVKDAAYEVPGNWVWIKFEYIVQDTKLGLVRGSKEQSKAYNYNYLKMNNISSKGDLDLSNLVNVDATDIEVENFSLKLGDFLFNTRNSRELVGKNTVVKNNFSKPMLFNNNIMRVRFNKVINPNVVSYYLNSPLGQLKLDEVKKVTTNVAAIYARDLNNIEIPLPPLKEQQRIVDRIESLFEKLDKAKKLIEEAREGFEKRRGLILNEAFKGKLTHNYRSENIEIQDATKLIYDIRQQLEMWYGEECIKAKANGLKKPRKLNFDIVKSEFEYLFKNIPSSWRISYFQEMIEPVENALKAGPFGSSLKKSMYVSDGYKVYGQEQVISGNIDYGDYYINQEKFEELKTCEVREGDLLISLVGTIGKTLLIPENYKKGIINPRLLKVSINKNINGEYIRRYFESPIAKHIMSEESHGGTMEILNLDIIKKLPIPIPPKEEQNEIVKILDKLLEEEVKIEELTQLEDQIELIKKSILAKAFRGELGTNCEEDESALELLKEILGK